MYEMNPEYYIGIDMIDEEHKQLFKYADEAYELLHDEYTPDKYDKIDIILENLRDYTVKHFSDEEEYLESIKVSNPHFKWGFNFYPSRVYSWFRQRRGFAAPLLLVAR